MLKNKITCLIFSCDKFSDLWNANLKLLRHNWIERDFETYIVTDKPTDRKFPDITIIAAGSEREWSERLKYALQYVKTDFIFVTLDDYFLIKKVDNARMEHLVNLMERYVYDYIRLYKKPTKATSKRLNGEKGLYHIKTDINYSVNLYPSFWSKKFLEYCVREPRTAWMFEVNLHKCAVEYGARCLVSYQEDYKILDVVRKGKILNKATRYFKKNPGIYEGTRELQPISYEIKLWFKTAIQERTPPYLFKFVRCMYVRFGGQSFTYQMDKEQKSF